MEFWVILCILIWSVHFLDFYPKLWLSNIKVEYSLQGCSQTQGCYSVSINETSHEHWGVLFCQLLVLHGFPLQRLSNMDSIMTSSNGNFSALLAICAGNSPVPSEFLTQRLVMWNFDVFFDLCPNKLLSKQMWGWWFEMPSRPLWRHCNGVSLPCHDLVCEQYWVN